MCLYNLEILKYSTLAEDTSVVAWEWLLRSGEKEVIIKGHKETFQVIYTSIILTVVIVSLVNIHVQSYQVIHFKFVQFIVCKLYCNKAVKIFNKKYK